METEMATRKCVSCPNEIPEARLLVLPETRHCVKCSTEKPKRGFIAGTAEGKSFDIVILEGDDPSVKYWEDREADM